MFQNIMRLWTKLYKVHKKSSKKAQMIWLQIKAQSSSLSPLNVWGERGTLIWSQICKLIGEHIPGGHFCPWTTVPMCAMKGAVLKKTWCTFADNHSQPFISVPCTFIFLKLWNIWKSSVDEWHFLTARSHKQQQLHRHNFSSFTNFQTYTDDMAVVERIAIAKKDRQG